jgi:hypothetical protein
MRVTGRRWGVGSAQQAALVGLDDGAGVVRYQAGHEIGPSLFA